MDPGAFICGATRKLERGSDAIKSASASVRFPPDLGETNKRSVPRDSICAVMACWVPLPIDIKDITAATPITIPSKVKKVLNLLAVTEKIAIMNTDLIFIISYPIR